MRKNERIVKANLYRKTMAHWNSRSVIFDAFRNGRPGDKQRQQNQSFHYLFVFFFSFLLLHFCNFNDLLKIQMISQHSCLLFEK